MGSESYLLSPKCPTRNQKSRGFGKAPSGNENALGLGDPGKGPRDGVCRDAAQLSGAQSKRERELRVLG